MDIKEALFVSKIAEIVNDEHIINKTKWCFVKHIVSYCYFQNQTRKDFVFLMRKYQIKQGPAIKIWNAFVPETTNDEMKVPHNTKLKRGEITKQGSNDIFISKESIKKLRDVIDEKFDNELMLYYYMDISTALQMNDHQMTEFTLLMDEYECILSIINYDLHIKGTGQCLYGVIVQNDNYTMEQNKWLWKLHQFMNAEQIERQYKIKQHQLPKSSRFMPRFQKQLGQILVIEESLIDDTDWFTVQQIKSLKRNVKIAKITVTLSKEIWIKECKKSFKNDDLPLIPVVVNKNNNHWIEWIKIIYIESQNIYVGISCKYDEDNDKLSVESLCLDGGDIYNKHRLVGLIDNKYSEQLKNFKISITEIKFSDNKSKNIDEEINTLKQQIKSQQDSIKRLNKSLGQVYRALVHRYINQYVDNIDIIKLVTFYYASFDILPLIKSFVFNNKINWNDLKLIKYQSTNNDGIYKSVSISKKAMDDFCFVALERLNNNYNDNLIQIVGEKIERILIVQVIDDNEINNIGVSFIYTHKSDNLFVATSLYLDNTEIKFTS